MHIETPILLVTAFRLKREMTRGIGLCVLLLLYLIAAEAALPFLRQRGIQVVDESGAVVKLRGVDLGGWLVWEGWMFGGNMFGDDFDGWDSETTILQGLTNIAGADAANQFHTDVQRLMVTEADFRAMRQMGFNSVRVPFNYRILMNLTAPYLWRDYGWNLLDNILNWAETNCIYVILDMHAAPGGQALGFPYDPTWPLLFNSEEMKSETVALWRAIAARYANRGVVAGYDLLGEPWPDTDMALRDMYARIIAAIRQVDNRHMFFLEGAQSARNFNWTLNLPPLDSNMAYSFHMYDWSEDNSTAQLALYASVANSQKVPMWVGEFGESTLAIDAKQVQWFEKEPTICGFTYWAWKKVPNYYDHLVKIPASPDWIVLMNSLTSLAANKSASNMTGDQARAAMQRFVQALVYNDSNVNPALVTALTANVSKPLPLCKTAAPPPPPPPPPTLSGYVGCFFDQATNRTLRGLTTATSFQNSAQMTIPMCRDFCGLRGYTYAGLQNSTQCWCGQSLAGVPRANNLECGSLCGGNGATRCGGILLNSVYLSTVTGFKGCFVDVWTKRDLSVNLYNAPNNTISACVSACKANNFSYAGLQYSQQCWCGNSYGRNGPANFSDCYMTCAGDPTQMCGSGLRNSIYEIKSVGVLRAEQSTATIDATAHRNNSGVQSWWIVLPVVAVALIAAAILVLVLAVIARNRSRLLALRRKELDEQLLPRTGY